MSSGLLTASDLEQRYGKLVPLTELTVYLHTSLRALRPMLRERGIVPIEVGRQELVSLNQIEVALNLGDMPAVLGQIELEMSRQVLMRHSSGRLKTIPEAYADVREGAEVRRAALDALR
jgi:hypothetical protein